MGIQDCCYFIGADTAGGTAGSVLFLDASAKLGQDNSNLFWDDTNNRLGLGTSSPALRLHVIDTTPQARLGYDTSNYVNFNVLSDGSMNISLVGSASASGFTFNKSATFGPNVGCGAAFNTTASLYTAGNLLTGTTQRAFLTQTTANENCTVAFQSLALQVRTKATSFTLPLGVGVKVFEASVGAGSTLTTQVGLDIDALAAAGTSNIGIRSLIMSSAAGGYNLYLSGSAPNYLAGNLSVGTTTASAAVHVLKTTEQLRLGYDSSNYASFTTASSGSLTVATTSATNSSITLTPSGTGQVVLSKNTTVPHIIGSSTAPTIAAGAGAGTGPTVSVSNATDLSGIVNITTGTSPAATSVIATITFNAAYGVAPNICLTPANLVTAGLAGGNAVHVTSTTTTMVINSGSLAGLTASTDFKWFYHVIQ